MLLKRISQSLFTKVFGLDVRYKSRVTHATVSSSSFSASCTRSSAALPGFRGAALSRSSTASSSFMILQLRMRSSPNLLCTDPCNQLILIVHTRSRLELAFNFGIF
ncbi:unnamed protein product [Malus baccata var. baccata]